MKKLLLILSLQFTIAGMAQQKPHYTQYVLNNYVLNPALTGIENYTDVKMSARDQWVGLNGAPKTFYLTVHAPLGKKDYKTSATSYDLPGENPRGKAYWENYTASESHHGLGFSIINDKTGLYNHFTADVSYAYHIGLSPRTNLAAGFSGGISKISYDRSKSRPADPNDPTLGNINNDIYKIKPDLNAGIWIYSADYFIGIAAQQIIPEKESNTSSPDLKQMTHLFTTAGYRFLLNEEINMLPSVMMKYGLGWSSKPQFDLNVKLQYMDLLWVGANYRIKEGYAGMIGLNVGNTFNVGYSYDFTRTNLNSVSKGTHEIMIGFLIGNRYDDSCPRNVW